MPADATIPARRATTNTGATNTATTYGWVERAFHWAIALLIPTVIALGVVAYEWPYDTDAALATKATLFSAHKTVGIAILFVALARIAWAISQPRPAAINGHRRVEHWAAATVHWLLYGSLVAVPLLGWAHHATAEGFAPIWWPLGQSLPLLPKDPTLSAQLATLHMTFERVLVLALLLHIAGAVKHAVWDRDGTVARMWRGAEPAEVRPAGRSPLPVVAALAVWAAALGAGLAIGPREGLATVAPVEAQAAEVTGAANWAVEEGTLSITVAQLGSPVTGSFADWQAAIDFSEEARADGTHGAVRVAVSTGSLTLGSVTSQAVGEEFLAAGAFPQAEFEAPIMRAADQGGDAWLAEGVLSLRGADVPVRLPFALEIEGDRATMEGAAEVDRRAFGMGEAYPDESSVGFGVTISVALSAVRAE
jgi:cytochrome b561/polyisoprenoid-binding protein YceI